MNETGISRIKREDELTISTRNSLRFSKYDDNFDRFVYLFFSLNNQQVKTINADKHCKIDRKFAKNPNWLEADQF